MQPIRSILLFLLILSIGSIFCYSASAANQTIINVVSPAGSGLLPPINNTSPGAAIGAIIAWFIGLTAVLTVLAITWAGVQMILATGEEEKFKKARHTMIYAFIGLIVAGLAYGAVNFVTNLKLDNFL